MKSSQSTVSKAVKLLTQLVHDGEPVGIHRLAAETGLNSTTVHRLLQTLVGEGLAAYDAHTRHYSVGPACVSLAAATLGGRSMVGRIQPIIRELADRLGETCAFYQYEPASKMLTVAVVEFSVHPIGYGYDVGRRQHIHAGASGRSILAFLSPGEIEAVLARPLERFTETTYTTPEALRVVLEHVRETGYAVSHGELTNAGKGVAVPVLTPTGRVIGSVGVTVPNFRFRDEDIPRFAEILKEGAQQLRAVVG